MAAAVQPGAPGEWMDGGHDAASRRGAGRRPGPVVVWWLLSGEVTAEGRVAGWWCGGVGREVGAQAQAGARHAVAGATAGAGAGGGAVRLARAPATGVTARTQETGAAATTAGTATGMWAGRLLREVSTVEVCL